MCIVLKFNPNVSQIWKIPRQALTVKILINCTAMQFLLSWEVLLSVLRATPLRRRKKAAITVFGPNVYKYWSRVQSSELQIWSHSSASTQTIGTMSWVLELGGLGPIVTFLGILSAVRFHIFTGKVNNMWGPTSSWRPFGRSGREIHSEILLWQNTADHIWDKQQAKKQSKYFTQKFKQNHLEIQKKRGFFAKLFPDFFKLLSEFILFRFL